MKFQVESADHSGKKVDSASFDIKAENTCCNEGFYSIL